jgi:hypothetical protein
VLGIVSAADDAYPLVHRAHERRLCPAA